jgi:hypothetical protein
MMTSRNGKRAGALKSASNSAGREIEGLMTLAIQIVVLVVLAIYAKAGAVALKRPISDFYAGGGAIPACSTAWRLPQVS